MMRKVLPLLFLGAIFMSCGKENPVQPTTGTITGTLTLKAGISGTPDNSRVAIYASYDDWANDRPVKYVAANGSGASATYTISEVVPGTYYLDAWKDMDNSGTINTGDLFGVYGTTQWPAPTVSPFSVAAGQTVMINGEMIAIP